MKPVSSKQTFDFIPSCDLGLPKEEQTVFELKTLTPREQAVLDNMFGSMRGEVFDMRIGDQQITALNLGLVGVRNFFDEDGTELKVTRGKQKLHGFMTEVDDKFLAKIPKEVRQEIANAIISGSDISEEEQKN